MSTEVPGGCRWTLRPAMCLAHWVITMAMTLDPKERLEVRLVYISSNYLNNLVKALAE